MAVPTPFLFSTGHIRARPSNNQGFPGKQIRVAVICQGWAYRSTPVALFGLSDSPEGQALAQRVEEDAGAQRGLMMEPRHSRKDVI